MRMWHQSLIPYLCTKHLNGMHGELHKFKPSFEKKHKITGRISPVVQIEPWRMAQAHDEVADEMLRRGGNHKSPYTMPDLSYLPINERFARVDYEENLARLRTCPECRERMLNL